METIHKSEISEKSHLCLFRREILLLIMIEWKVFVGVVEHPLAHVIGDVKSTVVVPAKLVVNEHELIVRVLQGLVLVPDENVPTLDVVVTKHNRGVDARKKFAEERKKKLKKSTETKGRQLRILLEPFNFLLKIEREKTFGQAMIGLGNVFQSELRNLRLIS